MTEFRELLARYRAESLSEAEKGTKFERLMRAYLLALPKFQGMFEKVWLWHDFPYRTDFGNGHDIGIDLVVLTMMGEYWAVQCKCYAADAYILKEDVDTFLSTSGRRFSDGQLEAKRFSRRLWISTTDRWSANAEASLQNQVPPVMKIGLSDLSQSPVDWAALEAKARCGLAAVGPEGGPAAWFAIAKDPAGETNAWVRLQGEAETADAPVALTFVCGMLFVLTVFGVGNGTFRRRVLAVFVPVFVLLSFAVAPQWRDSVCEMFAPVNHVQRGVGAEVAKTLPEGAFVIGERSTQVLMGQPFRTVTTMPGCNPIPIVEKLVKRDPQVKLYGLFDSQNAYNIQHLQKNKDRYDLRLLKKFSMPSFASAKPADVFFCQIVVKETRK